MAISKSSSDSSLETSVACKRCNNAGRSEFVINLKFIRYVTENCTVGASILLSFAVLLFAVLIMLFAVVINSSNLLWVDAIFDFVEPVFMFTAGAALGSLRKSKGR